MARNERIRKLNELLQVEAFNLADRLDTLNYHSRTEAVRDLSNGVYHKVDEMMKSIRDLGHNLVADGREEEREALRDMYALLDTVRKCSLEPESYRFFLDSLPALLEALGRWGEEGPLGEAAE